MTIADTLSRACTTDNTTDRMEEELKCACSVWLNPRPKRAASSQGSVRTANHYSTAESTMGTIHYLKYYNTITGLASLLDMRRWNSPKVTNTTLLPL